MRSKISTLNEIVEQEVNKLRDSIYEEITTDIVQQVLACCLIYLEQDCGFRKIRLKKALHGICSCMKSNAVTSILNNDNLVTYINKKYNIDLTKSDISLVDDTSN